MIGHGLTEGLRSGAKTVILSMKVLTVLSLFQDAETSDISSNSRIGRSEDPSIRHMFLGTATE